MKINNINYEDCSGCTACMNICPVNAITMNENQEGFLYPKIDESKCINCGICYRTCPFKEEWVNKNKSEVPEVYALKNKDELIRIKSTSGGAFGLIADYFLNKKGIIYGAAFDENYNVKHVRVDSKQMIDKLRGSKYVQSFLGNIFVDVKSDLDLDKEVLFIGTPCQVAGLKSFLKKDYRNLTLIDIICHGVPSPKIFKEHIKVLQEKANKKIKSYNFRSKINGWHKHTESVEYIDGSIDYKSNLVQSYKQLFCEHSILRLSCNNCKFTDIIRISDFTLGDYWGIEDSHKEFDDNKGVSLLLVNTAKARNIFEEIKDKCVYIKTNTNDCVKKNHFKPTRISPARKKFWSDYYKYGYEYIIKKYSCCGLKMKIMLMLKNITPYKLRKIIKNILKR